MILRKTIPRTIKEKKFQYGGVTILLVLAVMLYVSLSMAISTLDKRNQQFSENYNQESFHFLTGSPLSQVQLQRLEDQYPLTLEARKYQDISLGEDTTLRILGETQTINIPYISEGSMPKNPGDVALAKMFAQKNDYEIGDSIEMNGVKGKVTGYVYLPDYIYMIKQQYDLLSNAKEFGIGVTSEETFQQMSGSAQTEVLGWNKEDKLPPGFTQEVQNITPILQFVAREDNTRIQFVESEINGASTTISSLSVFILALSVAMILMLMKRRLDMQRKEIGTLLALGYRKKELLLHYLGYAWFIGLTGSILGILAGAGLSVPFSNLYSNYFNLPRISLFDWSPAVLIVGFIIPVVLLVLLTSIVIYRALNKDPLTLLRPKEITTGKKSWLEKLPFLNSGSFIRRFRLRLLVRSKSRSFYIFLGVMFSTILLFFGFISFRSMDQLVDSTYQDIQTYNYAVHFKSLQTEELSSSQSPFVTSEMTVHNEKDKAKVTSYGIKPATEYIKLLNGSHLLNDQLKDGAVVSQPLAAILNLHVGDPLTIENTINEKELKTEVTGITDIYIGKSIYLPLDKENEFLGYPKGSYTALWQNEKPKITDDVFLIEDKQKVIDSFEASSGATRYSVFGMAGFAMVIGVLVLTLLTNLIVEENSPSISLFKVMGYHDKEISSLVLNVYTPIVFLSYFLSIPLALFGLNQIFNSMAEQTGFLFPTEITWWMVLLGLGIIWVTYWISLSLSKRKLKQVSLQEALKKQQD